MAKLKKIFNFVRENDFQTIITVVKRRFASKLQKAFINNTTVSKADFPLREKQKIESVTFLYDLINAQKGSTILRSHQVYEIVKGEGSVLPLHITHDSSGIKNSIVIMDKYSSTFASRAMLRKLREANNILISDPVDDEIIVEKYSQFDGLIASSIKQYAYFKEHFPKMTIAYLFHHADIRLPKKLAPQDEFKAAYFGEPSNMYDFPGLNEWIQPVPVDTSKQKLGWMSSIANYNFHYAVRSKGYSERVFKPFTKGFTAAHFGANILVHADDGDAGIYLGTQYPFLLKGELSPKAVIEMMTFARESFSSETWRKGLSVMEEIKNKTDPAKLKDNFWAFIREFL